MSDDWIDDPTLSPAELRARFDELMANGESVEVASGPKPVGIYHQCSADIQSAHAYKNFDHVVASIDYPQGVDLVGELIVVQDLEPDGPTCVGRVIEQDQTLIMVAVRL